MPRRISYLPPLSPLCHRILQQPSHRHRPSSVILWFIYYLFSVARPQTTLDVILNHGRPKWYILKHGCHCLVALALPLQAINRIKTYRTPLTFGVVVCGVGVMPLGVRRRR